MSTFELAIPLLYIGNLKGHGPILRKSEKRTGKMTAIGNIDDALPANTAASNENSKTRLRVQKACELCKKRKSSAMATSHA